MQLKSGVDYYFWASYKYPSGTFLLSVTGPGGALSKPLAFSSDSTNDARKVSFIFNPSDSGDHSIYVTTVAAPQEGSYLLYSNRAGATGYWWMIVIGIVILLAILLPLFMLINKSKRKRRRSRRR